MIFAEWRKEAVKLAREHSELTELSEEVVRETLLQLHRLVGAAPNSVIDSYRQVQEDELIRSSGEALDRLSAGDFSWPRHDSRNEYDWIWPLAVQIRALDSALLTLVKSDYGPPADPNESYSSSRSGSFVIPRKHLRQPSAAKRNGQSFSRRGLLHHRILPRELRGYEIYLIWNDTISHDTDSLSIIAGAALFKNLKIKTASDASNGFIVVDVSCDDAEGTVEHQIEQSLSDRCFSVVWPELVVPPGLRKYISELLKARALDADPRPAPQILVAGTWHEDQGGAIINQATVLDGYGDTKLTFQKLIPFMDRELGIERVKRGTRLPILLTDTHLIAFAVCRDYCDLSLSLPYQELDVDLVLVPSMGNEKTMEGHQATAKAMRVLYDARAFVVQQANPPVAGEVGLVLPLPDDPTAQKPQELRQFTVWQSYRSQHN